MNENLQKLMQQRQLLASELMIRYKDLTQTMQQYMKITELERSEMQHLLNIDENATTLKAIKESKPTKPKAPKRRKKKESKKKKV